jgi:hypothetical protein
VTKLHRLRVARQLFGLSIALLLPFFFSNCHKFNDPFSEEDKETSNNESAQECTTNELDDIATSILNSSPDSGSAGGRENVTPDDRFSCPGTTIVFSNVSADKTSGVVTITFGPDGCVDKKGNTRKGIIIINWWGGRWYQKGSTHKVKLVDYTINDVTIDGSQTVTCTDYQQFPLSVTWNIASNHTATWPDGTYATRSVHKTRKWVHTATEDTFTLTNGILSNGAPAVNSAEGTNRHGVTFKVYITSPLVYIGSCAKANKVFIPVQGQKVVTAIGSSGKTKSFTMDYGGGACDNTYTVTTGTTVRTLTAKNDSSGD